MEKIENLWELQNHSNILKEINRALVEIANNNKLKELGTELRKNEEKIKIIEKTMKIKENGLNKGNSILKEYDYKLRMVENSLYEGNVTDLKQLTFLNQERDNIKDYIEGKETEILNQFEELEELKEEIVIINNTLKEQKKRYSEIVKDHKIFAEDLKTRAISEKSRIDKISSIISKELLKKYNELNKSKGMAVVEVIGNRCGGCNMMLPAITIDRLKNKNVVLHCENCDRILYLKK